MDYRLARREQDMTLAIVDVPTPLSVDAGGAVRVGATRVTLDTVVAAFLLGATAEEIAQDYSTLDLVDVYSVIAYYLRNRPEVDAYLRQRQQEADDLRKRYGMDQSGIRERLLARRSNFVP